jgi:GNAT superfamily N-acetyltransferase
MSWDEFDPWAEQSVRGFATRLVDAGLMSSGEAADYARRQLAELLPSGIATPLHLLRTVRETTPGEPVVGQLWLRVAPVQTPAAGVEGYVFDIELVEDARGRGLGTATMLAAEQLARDLGADAMRLTVFERDAQARRLYDRLGYVPVATASTDAAGSAPRLVTNRSTGTPGGAVWSQTAGTEATAQLMTKAL